MLHAAAFLCGRQLVEAGTTHLIQLGVNHKHCKRYQETPHNLISLPRAPLMCQGGKQQLSQLLVQI